MSNPAATSNGGGAQPPSGGPVAMTLPKTGVARVKSVLSGDSVVLMGKPLGPGQQPPECLFTFSSVLAPRLASKANPVDEGGAFPAREWLRKLVVGKMVRFETRRQQGPPGGGSGDRVYGWLFLDAPTPLHLAVECVRQGHGTPRAIKYPSNRPESTEGDAAAATEEDPQLTEEQEYEKQLLEAYREAQEAGRGIHDTKDVPMVRTVKNAGEDVATLALVETCQKVADQKRITCVIEYIFDGSRFRCQVTDPNLPEEFQHTNFTLLLAGVICPRLGNPKADPPTAPESFSDDARQFVQLRLLQRELPISLLGTDKVGAAAVGVVHHPIGNIAVELLKNGLARMTDWSVRMMAPGDVPALRVAENNAKRTLKGIWHSYAPPVLSSASKITGTVVEVVSGDTLLILPTGKEYDSEDALMKISLASVRSPRVGSTLAGRADEPYSVECKDRLRLLTVGKDVQVDIHYERDIPIQPGVTEKRPFGTFCVGPNQKIPDISEVLIQEGLAVTQRHRDDDEKSPRYDELRAAEAAAKAAKKGVHKAEGKDGDAGGKAGGKRGGKGPSTGGAINDLTDPRKAKAYSGSLMRAGMLKAVVDYVFNGALFKLHIPSENCYIRFAPSCVRCPQPSPSPGSKVIKTAEPFGDESKRYARLHVLQRQVEIDCSGVSNSGIITGTMFVRPPGSGRRDYGIELLGAGLANVDQRKIDYGEAPKHFIDAQNAAKENKVGIWSIERPVQESQAPKAAEKSKERIVKIKLSEIRSGSHFFFHVANDEAAKVMEDSMRLFTQNNGTAGAPCDIKINKVVAALFDDGTGKSWYRAKIVERKGPGKVAVLFVDHGNVATVPVSSHLRPLDVSLGTDRIPPVASEAVLALTNTRPINTDEGLDAARLLQGMCWGKELTAHLFSPDETGKLAVTVAVGDLEETINSKLITDGLARVAKPASVEVLSGRMVDPSPIVKLAADLNVAQETARKTRSGMWRYGDIGDDDDEGAL